MKTRGQYHLHNLHRRMRQSRIHQTKSLYEVQDREEERKKQAACEYEKKDRRIALERQESLRHLKEIRQRRDSTIDTINHDLINEYYGKILQESERNNRLAENARKECILNLLGATLVTVISFASVGIIPSIIMLVGGILTMGGFFYKKWSIDEDFGSNKEKGLIKALLAGSFLKRTDDILKGCFMLGGLTGVLSAVALPFAAITFVASALAFAAAAYNYKKAPSTAAKYALIGTGLNMASSMALIGVGIASLIMGAAVLANPIGLAVVGALLVGGATVKLVSALKERKESNYHHKRRKREQEFIAKFYADKKAKLGPEHERRVTNSELVSSVRSLRKKTKQEASSEPSSTMLWSDSHKDSAPNSAPSAPKPKVLPIRSASHASMPSSSRSDSAPDADNSHSGPSTTASHDTKPGMGNDPSARR